MSGYRNINSRTAETVSVVCPSCAEKVEFRPIIRGVQIHNAHDVVKPRLVVELRSDNVVMHECVTPDDRTVGT